MELDSYAVTSKNQYAAHANTRSQLSSAMERLANRSNLEDQHNLLSGLPRRRRHIVDLGSADGTSSMKTLRFAIETLNQFLDDDEPLPLHVTFEEHPASNETKLQDTVAQSNSWMNKYDVTHNLLMKSFYEPLFEAESIDFFMSYICLHWLDASTTTSKWKNLGMDKLSTQEQNELLQRFVMINETSAPDAVRDTWRTTLAQNHLANFLTLRSQEMRTGAEALLVMVGHPHEYITPKDGGPSPLTRAMKNCVDRGQLRESVLGRTIVPYFCRTVEDVKAAFDLAATNEAGGLLELLECQSFETITIGEEEEDALGGAFDLFWSIHSSSVESAEPTTSELACIKEETRRTFDDIYDPNEGIASTFIVVTFRKRSRAKWNAR